jgi:hypothetical protein
VTAEGNAASELDRAATRRRHAAWLRECARRAELLAAEYRANADRIDPDIAADDRTGQR